jgi:hypothetical protein
MKTRKSDKRGSFLWIPPQRRKEVRERFLGLWDAVEESQVALKRFWKCLRGRNAPRFHRLRGAIRQLCTVSLECASRIADVSVRNGRSTSRQRDPQEESDDKNCSRINGLSIESISISIFKHHRIVKCRKLSVGFRWRNATGERGFSRKRFMRREGDTSDCRNWSGRLRPRSLQGRIGNEASLERRVRIQTKTQVSRKMFDWKIDFGNKWIGLTGDIFR